MTRDEDEERTAVQAALDQAMKESESATAKVDHYEFDLYVDSTGEEAVRVTIVLADAGAAGSTFGWRDVEPLRSAVLRAFLANGIERWPYVDFRLKSELDTDTDGRESAGTPT